MVRPLPRFAVLNLAILLALLASLLPAASAYQPAVEWNRTFGSSYGDGAWSVQQASDGGYITTGYTCSEGRGSDLWLIKVSPDGQEEWSRIFGGSGEDIGYYVRQTGDGGYIVTGSTSSYGIGKERLWLLKVSPEGWMEWERTYGGFVSSSGDGGWSLDITADGGYIIAGYTRSFGAGGKDLWLIKVDSLGRKVWDRTFGGARDDVGFSVELAGDGGYVVTGQTESYGSGGSDLWIVKTDIIGREEWNRTFRGEKDVVGFEIERTIDGGYVISGRTDTGQVGRERALLLKVDSMGRKEWERNYAGTGVMVATSEDTTMDGGYIIAGRTESGESGKDLWLMRTDSQGREVWDIALGGGEDDIGTSVGKTTDGGYIVAGITESFGHGAEDLWLIKIGPDQISSKASEGDVLLPGDQIIERISAVEGEDFKAEEPRIDVIKTKPKSNVLETNINQVLKKKIQS